MQQSSNFGLSCFNFCLLGQTCNRFYFQILSNMYVESASFMVYMGNEVSGG